MNSKDSPKRLCTCQKPQHFDLTSILDRQIDGLNQQVLEEESNVVDKGLLGTLHHHGWTVVEVRVTKKLQRLYPNLFLDDNSNDILNVNARWKRELQNIFQNRNDTRSSCPPINGVYRQAESGSSQEGMVEPKESWEIQRCNENKNINTDQRHVLYAFMNLMHRIAETVRNAVHLPKNLLLHEGDIITAQNVTAKNEISNQMKDSNVGDNNSNNINSPVDLLRAFYYHRVDPKQSSCCLGSSEHTDWGSFTVVWQDDTGGLETYCHACQCWNSVPPTPTKEKIKDEKNNFLSFVVHVGDVTSLALGLAQTQLFSFSDTKIYEDNVTMIHNFLPARDLSRTWPSPRHRVVSPTKQPRVSLVYFAYPPPQYSIAEIAFNLYKKYKFVMEQNHDTSASDDKNHGQEIPFSDFFLLQNQESGAGHKAETAARDQLARIINLPLKKVLSDKWKQVQRMNY